MTQNGSIDLDSLQNGLETGAGIWPDQALALIHATRELVRAARDFLPQEATSGGIGKEDWDDLRTTLLAFADHESKNT